jgi:hypothetical protein
MTKEIESNVKPEVVYDREDDVEIETVESIPQPDRIEKNIIRVKDIKREIEDCDRAITDATDRKAVLNKLLTDNKKAIKDAVKKTP